MPLLFRSAFAYQVPSARFCSDDNRTGHSFSTKRRDLLRLNKGLHEVAEGLPIINKRLATYYKIVFSELISPLMRVSLEPQRISEHHLAEFLLLVQVEYYGALRNMLNSRSDDGLCAYLGIHSYLVYFGFIQLLAQEVCFWETFHLPDCENIS